MSVDRHQPPYRVAGVLLVVIVAAFGVLISLQYRGTFASRTQLTVVSPRAGLVVDPGSKVTFNGVEIGRVAGISTVERDGAEQAALSLEVDDRYVPLIPTNVVADVRASTVFGNKYVAFSSPKDPSPQHVSSGDVIPAESVTTEFNTLFETVISIAQKVDPIKLNQTLTSAAQALSGLGDRFGESLEQANLILADLNPQIPRLREDTARVADLADVYTGASSDLLDGLDSAVTTARTFNAQTVRSTRP